MRISKSVIFTVGALAAVVLLSAAPASAAVTSAAMTKLEAKCAGKVAKGAAKVSNTVIKETMKCRDRDISGKTVGVCPSSASNAKVAKANAKLAKIARKTCGSTCKLTTDLFCLVNAHCPPLGATDERCSGDTGLKVFDMNRVGFPGAFCDGVLGHEILSADDIAECAGLVVTGAANNLVTAVYGGTTNASSLSKGAQKCLSGIGKSANKLVQTILKGTVKCRGAITKGKIFGDPVTCALADPKIAGKIAKIQAKLSTTFSSKCSDETVAVLDLCGNGVGGTADVVAAEACILDAAREIADGQELATARNYSSKSIIEGAFPPAPSCGDGIVNQLAGFYLRLGEECDGDDDSACPGLCFPPGDLFECTCANVARILVINDGPGSDNDTGWTGLAHNQPIPDQGGYIQAVSGCDCDDFDGLNCVGNSTDSVCDLDGYQTPVCSGDPHSQTSCDQHGDNNGRDTDSDCYVCDQYNTNVGDSCTNSSGCQAQCHDTDLNPTGQLCDRQSDCDAGSFCRGRCDDSRRCLKSYNGGPLPVSTASSAACATQVFRTNTTGTVNIQTGASEEWYGLFAGIFLGVGSTYPCPICGGFCDGGSRPGDTCEGTCENSGAFCRFDSDCSDGEACDGDTPLCPDGGTCVLENICRWGPNEGETCKIDYRHAQFGTMSNHCPPDKGKNISGDGLRAENVPLTTTDRTFVAELPCSSPGYELFSCHCPDDGGALTKPNSCSPACTAGAEAGQGCADSNSTTGGGDFTACAGGANVGKACDEDGDCPGSSCSVNPLHCSGDAAYEHMPCSGDGDCGSGSCVDACPQGRCVPLCVAKDGAPYEGVCAAGPPVFHCESGKYTGRNCPPSAAYSDCQATCSGSGVLCTGDEQCPAGQTCAGPCDTHRECGAGLDGILGNWDDLFGAGACIADERSCFSAQIPGTGGTTLNGKGDATNVFQNNLTCYTSTNNAPTNNVTGLGGPARNHKHATRIPNFTSLP
ncbi:MAG: hypothetical protein VCA74_07290 [Deltaproteobacteria bacterium]